MKMFQDYKEENWHMFMCVCGKKECFSHTIFYHASNRFIALDVQLDIIIRPTEKVISSR